MNENVGNIMVAILAGICLFAGVRAWWVECGPRFKKQNDEQPDSFDENETK